MNPFEFVFKLLWTAWPFVKELVLDGRSLKHAFQFNRRRAIFSIVVMASFLFNILNVGVDSRMVSVLMKYVKLQKDHQALVVDNDRLKQELVDSNCKLPDTFKVPASTSVAADTTPSQSLGTHGSEGPQNPPGSTDYEMLKNTFSTINQH